MNLTIHIHFGAEVKNEYKLNSVAYGSFVLLCSGSYVDSWQCLLLFGPESVVFHFAIHNSKIEMWRRIVLPVALYGCETWSLTLREERRLMVFENRVLRRVFEPKREEMKRDWTKLHNEELNDLY